MPIQEYYDLESLLKEIEIKNSGQDEFLQAVREIFKDALPIVNSTEKYLNAALLERLAEPERIITFRVAWEDDNNAVQVNRGYRVQFNGAIGPYKGGLRFHPSVNESILKFLGFEQTFKNALTGLPMGGGKGGADFDPAGRSDREIMRFCSAFMRELHRHIGSEIDVPAGDINVGAREIGYLFGAYRSLTNEFEGAITGKGLSFGGSELRTEATGYGLVYFVCAMLEAADTEIEGQTIALSGSGNVALYAAEKALDLGAHIIAMSDSGGTIVDKGGIDREKLEWIMDHKSRSGASLSDYAEQFDADWHKDKTPWSVECDIALPCATQNEMDAQDVKRLIDNGCGLIAEGANMPLTSSAAGLVRQEKILFAPAKAANAGGVAVSGLEISQNRLGRSKSKDEIGEDLNDIMRMIHKTCAEEGQSDDGHIDYARGANIAAFRKIADATIAQGII